MHIGHYRVDNHRSHPRACAGRVAAQEWCGAARTSTTQRAHRFVVVSAVTFTSTVTNPSGTGSDGRSPTVEGGERVVASMA